MHSMGKWLTGRTPPENVWSLVILYVRPQHRVLPLRRCNSSPNVKYLSFLSTPFEAIQSTIQIDGSPCTPFHSPLHHHTALYCQPPAHKLWYNCQMNQIKCIMHAPSSKSHAPKTLVREGELQLKGREEALKRTYLDPSQPGTGASHWAS